MTTNALSTILANQLAADPHHQIAKWRLMVDWWSGKIIPHISNKERATHAIEQVVVWTSKLAAL